MATAAPPRSRPKKKQAEPEAPPQEQLATRYASDIVYRALLHASEPLKMSEVVRAVDRPDVDLKLTRVVLVTDPRITAAERKWKVWTRLLDPGNPLERNVRQILADAGQPVRIPVMARMLGDIYGRPAEVYEELLRRFAAAGDRYITVEGDYVIPCAWILDVQSGDPDDILFVNFIDEADVDALAAADDKVKPTADNPASITRLLDEADAPVPSRVLQYLLYRRAPDRFDGRSAYRAIFEAFNSHGAFPLSDGTWIGPAVAHRLAGLFPVIAEKEVGDDAEGQAQEAAKPLVITPERLEELVRAIQAGSETVMASQLLEEIYEVTPDFPTYTEDLDTLTRTLRADDRVVWVGGERFRPEGSIPVYVYSVPGLLQIPEDTFVDAEGNQVDLLLEDDGLEGGLEREILNPLAQDVLDEEPVTTTDHNPPSNARAVIKFHHKAIGTLPLCQFPAGFFPSEPAILDTEFTLPGGNTVQVWVNNDTRLLYGLFDWYQAIPIDSGATFTLERQSLDRYIVNYNDESEPSMFISRNRLDELIAVQERADAEQLTTFDIVREIIEHYRKGIEYLTLLTEVNVVRRVTRRMVASILSEYHCFIQRGTAWVFDAKKLPQGFDRSKRKYLAR